MTAAVCPRCLRFQNSCSACCGLPDQLLVVLWPDKSSCSPAMASPAVTIVCGAHSTCNCVPAGVLMGKQKVSRQPHLQTQLIVCNDVPNSAPELFTICLLKHDPEHSRGPAHLPVSISINASSTLGSTCPDDWPDCMLTASMCSLGDCQLQPES